LPWRRCFALPFEALLCFAFCSLPTYLLVTKQCVNNIACVQQSDQSWSNTHHDWSVIVVTRCILEYYKQCVNHCLRLNTFCLDLSVQTSWLNSRHILSGIIDKQSDLSWSTTDHD
jgi:hypothetical protein